MKDTRHLVREELMFVLVTVLSCVLVTVTDGFLVGGTDGTNTSGDTLNEGSGVTCWTCPNKTDNENCNNWAPNIQCPLNHTVCMTIHRINTHSGHSTSVQKSCVMEESCTWDMVGCYETENSNIMECVSCCNYDYCNEPVPFNHSTALDLSVSVISNGASYQAAASYSLIIIAAIITTAYNTGTFIFAVEDLLTVALYVAEYIHGHFKLLLSMVQTATVVFNIRMVSNKISLNLAVVNISKFAMYTMEYINDWLRLLCSMVLTVTMAMNIHMLSTKECLTMASSKISTLFMCIISKVTTTSNAISDPDNIFNMVIHIVDYIRYCFRTATYSYTVITNTMSTILHNTYVSLFIGYVITGLLLSAIFTAGFTGTSVLTVAALLTVYITCYGSLITGISVQTVAAMLTVYITGYKCDFTAYKSLITGSRNHLACNRTCMRGDRTVNATVAPLWISLSALSSNS